MTSHPHGHCGPDGPHAHPYAPIAEQIDGVDPLSSGVLSSMRKMMHLNRQFLQRLSGPEKAGRFGRMGVLRVLGGHEGISQRELAEFLHLSAPTVTTMLQKMELEGLVERWNDETDQRITRIRLTEAGGAQAEELKEVFADYVRTTIGSLSEDERRELARLLDLLSDNTATALKRLDASAS
jgi:DNA-binding MarR family transcriptional regulator